MSGGLRASLVGTIMATTAVLVLTLVLLEDPLVEHRVTAAVRDDLQAAANAVARELDAGSSPDPVADRVGAEHGVRVVVIGPKGQTLGDTAHDGGELSLPHGLGEELLQRARSEGRAVRTEATEEGGGRLRVAVAASGGRVVAVGRPLATVEAAREGVRELLLVAGLLAVAIGGVLTFVLSRTMVGPIRQVTRVANELAAGDLSARTRSRRADELGTLGRSIDEMADQLAERLRTLRAEEARLRTVLDAMIEAVFVTDRRGHIVLTNAALDRLVEGEVRGRTAVEAIRSAELHEAVGRARKGEPGEVEVELRVGGERRWLSAQVAPLPDAAGVVAVLHDVTKLKLADRIRRDFVANASHELRTPLTAIRGFGETLRDGAAADPETASRFADTIVKHTLRLERLVDDLLSLSTAESPEEHYELSPLDPGAVAAEVLGGLQAQAQEKDIELEGEALEGLPAALGNERALDQILVNLVDNAIKYTPEQGRVTVRGAPGEQTVTLEVQDTGPGIPPKHLDRIFERFYRVDKGRSRAVGGTGLGLSIVKHLAARMKAEVDVYSRLEHGTTFRLTMPRARAAAREGVEDAPASAAPTEDALR